MGATAYRTVAAPVRGRVEVRRSVFECRLHRVETQEQVREVVAAARAEHWRARHHCSASVLGPDGAMRRSSDDGEPSGTAGGPMLEVLVGAGVSDVAAVVTRWFGGVLLGSGGLVRAYSDAVRAALDEAVEQRRELLALGRLEVDHARAGRLEHELRGRGVLVREVGYAARVTLHLATPVRHAEALQDLLAELTGGEGRLETAGTAWLDVPPVIRTGG